MSGNRLPTIANIRQGRGAMLIAPGVHLVLSGEAGFGLSHPLDCSAYAIESAQGAVLFDRGTGADADGVGVALAAAVFAQRLWSKEWAVRELRAGR